MLTANGAASQLGSQVAKVTGMRFVPTLNHGYLLSLMTPFVSLARDLFHTLLQPRPGLYNCLL